MHQSVNRQIVNKSMFCQPLGAQARDDNTRRSMNVKLTHVTACMNLVITAIPSPFPTSPGQKEVNIFLIYFFRKEVDLNC